MSPNRTLFPLNDNASEIVAFLERNFLLENGKPIRFEDWQKQHVLTPVFERSKHSWDTFLNGLPKKNGKSTLAACVAEYGLLLDDPNPQVFGCAGDKDQAKIIFDSTAKSIKRGPLRRYFKFYADAIERADGAGVYRVLASDASGSHGLNPSCVIWDELWNQPSWDLWEALTHSPTRAHPFHFIVTYRTLGPRLLSSEPVAVDGFRRFHQCRALPERILHPVATSAPVRGLSVHKD